MNCCREFGLIPEKVIFLDYVSDRDLPYLYCWAKAFVLPSLHEGFGVPIIEAMACGVPVITSNCAAMPEIAGDAAIFVDPSSVESIEMGFRTVLGSEQLCLSLKKRGLERAKRFSWGASATTLYSVFKKLCN